MSICIIRCMKDKRIKNLGFTIKIERMKKKLTQFQLAELSNVSMETIQKIESGKQNPSILIVINIAKALDISIDDLCKDL